MNGKHLLLERLQDVERVTGIVCRRNGLRDAEAEDFASYVKLRLIENDCAILRKFEGRSQFATYATIVVRRFLIDYRNHMLGKWKPSAAAKRIGETAIALERLVHRDRRPLEEAISELAREGADRALLETIASGLRSHSGRWMVDLDSAEGLLVVSVDEAESAASSGEWQLAAATTSAVVRDALTTLPAEDRQLFRLHFEAGLSIAEIARSLRLEQKPIYRRVRRMLECIRVRLEGAGIGAVDAEELIRIKGCELDFGFVAGNATDGPSNFEEAGEVGDGESRQ